MSITDFDIIFSDNRVLQANPTSDDAITLGGKAKNLASRIKQFRNSDFPKIIAELIKASNKMEETQITEKETASGWIVKRKKRKFEDKNNGMLDTILFQNQIISKAAQDVYTKINTPQKGYSLDPFDCSKPKILSLSSMKNEWETLLNWVRKMKEYIASGHTDPEANKHTPTVRTLLKGFLDDNICQRVETNFDLATTVDQLFDILEREERVFWPLDKRLKY